MIVTEKQAAEQWCPEARMEPHGRNRSVQFDDAHQVTVMTGNLGVQCIGSKCMHWRWAESAEQTVKTTGYPPGGEGWQETAISSDEGPMKSWRRQRPNRGGYCGLSGRPEYP